MKERIINTEHIDAYGIYLRSEERSSGTIEKYLRDVKNFYRWLKGRPVSKELAAEWKKSLLSEGYAPVTVNSMIAALNGLFRFLGWDHCRIRFLKLQRRLFREDKKELSRREYQNLVKTALRKGKKGLALLMETICATGIRVSEVRYITVETAKKRKAEISLKGKIRCIFIPGKLAKKLLKYAEREKICGGEIFVTKEGKSLSRRKIWGEMKKLAKEAGVEESKVFPHNLRHLFARTFYRMDHDLVRLADVLGHSSIETTRLYLVTTGTEHEKQMNRMGLLI